MKNKIILVSGANKGIGKEVVKQLAKKGHRVYLGTRNILNKKEIEKEMSAHGDVRILEIDLTNQTTIKSAYEYIKKDSQRLDVLINNAAICKDWAGPSKSDIGALRSHFETNFFGVVMLTQAMLPLLRNGESKNIINVSTALSSLALQGEESWPYRGVNLLAYNSSKTALNMFTVSLAKELKPEGFTVNVVNPGHTRTDLGGDNAPNSVEEGAAISVKLADSDVGVTGLFLSSNGVVPW